MNVTSAAQSVARIPARVREYAQPRPTTVGDLPGPSAGSGAIAGAIQGYITGGPFGAASGALGGFMGVKAGEGTGSFVLALGAGALAGA
ncbi:MAG: hypothetical protein AB1758_27590, partial [Candidatus Eremiobacterota bacterium]